MILFKIDFLEISINLRKISRRVVGCWFHINISTSIFSEKCSAHKDITKKVKIEAVRATGINGFTPHKY